VASKAVTGAMITIKARPTTLPQITVTNVKSTVLRARRKLGGRPVGRIGQRGKGDER
jgi:hypothetical protein